MSRPISIAAVLTAVVASTSVSGASATESTIYPGVGIGKVMLGMTAAQVRHALGSQYIVNRQKTISGTHYVEYGWDFSHWTVTLAQHGRTQRAVQVATDLHDQRTAQGIGYGTFWRRLLRAYPGGQCAWGNHYSPFGYYVEYLVGHKGGTQTLYTLGFVVKGIPPRIVNFKVIEVRVRTPFELLPEFGAHATPMQRCAAGWQNTDTPDWVRG